MLLCEIRSCESTMHPVPAHILVFAGHGLHSTLYQHTSQCLQVLGCTAPCTSTRPSVCRSGTAQYPAPMYSPVFAGHGLHSALYQHTSLCLQVMGCIAPCTNTHPSGRRSRAAQRPVPAHIPVFAGLGLHSTRHGADSLDQISLISTVQTDRYNTGL